MASVIVINPYSSDGELQCVADHRVDAAERVGRGMDEAIGHPVDTFDI